jgi:Beta-1,4-xylanase
MKVRGHCLFWAVQEEQPPWLLKAKPTEIKGAIRKRLYEVLKRYRNR